MLPREWVGTRNNYDMQEYQHSGSQSAALFDDEDDDWTRNWISKKMNNIYWATMVENEISPDL